MSFSTDPAHDAARGGGVSGTGERPASRAGRRCALKPRSSRRLLAAAAVTAACIWQNGRLPQDSSSLFDTAFAQEQPTGPADDATIPLRQVSDPYPVFNGIAVDPVNGVVAMSDVNRKGLLSYRLAA